MGVEREVFFVESPRGPLFCIATRPKEPAKGGVLYLPPFAEEMNKSRRMAALAARAFAARGWCTLQIDLAGTGDSAGEFGQFGWDDWLDDVTLAWSLLSRCTGGPKVIWSLRAGSLLAADWLNRSEARPPMLLWQPVFNGRKHLTQFLRLKAANEALSDADARDAMRRVREALDAGTQVQIAGYALSPGLARGLDAASFAMSAGYPAPLHALEIGSVERSEVTPGLAMEAHRLSEAGVICGVEVVSGPPFWTTQEVEEAPRLIERSVAVLDGWQS